MAWNTNVLMIQQQQSLTSLEAKWCAKEGTFTSIVKYVLYVKKLPPLFPSIAGYFASVSVCSTVAKP